MCVRTVNECSFIVFIKFIYTYTHIHINIKYIECKEKKNIDLVYIRTILCDAKCMKDKKKIRKNKINTDFIYYLLLWLDFYINSVFFIILYYFFRLFLLLFVFILLFVFQRQNNCKTKTKIKTKHFSFEENF